MKMTFTVPDMSCMHCKRTLEKALEQIPGVTWFAVHLDTKKIELKGKFDPKSIQRAVQDAGYTFENGL